MAKPCRAVNVPGGDRLGVDRERRCDACAAAALDGPRRGPLQAAQLAAPRGGDLRSRRQWTGR